MSEPVRYDVRTDGVGVIEINRPHAHNAVNCEVQQGITSILDTVESDPSIRCLVLASAGGRAFSAGWDIKELVGFSDKELARVLSDRDEWLWRWYSFPIPTIAALRGLSAGVGSYLAVSADLRVGGPGTRFQVTASSYGGTGLTWLLPDVVGNHHAKDILFTARVIDGPECRDMGLLSRYATNDDDIVGTATELASQIAALPPSGVQNAKRLLRERAGRSTRERYDAENRIIAAMGSSVSELFSGFVTRNSSQR